MSGEVLGSIFNQNGYSTAKCGQFGLMRID